MKIESFTLKQFRNYDEARFDFSPGTNVIVGENAQGKTNLLEGIYYLTGGRSFRGVKDRELIMRDRDAGLIAAEVTAENRAFQLEVHLSAQGRRRILCNKVPLKTLKDLSGRVRAVLFSPDDLRLVKEGAAERRRFMDLCFSQLRPRYHDVLMTYNRVRDHKLRILKDGGGLLPMLETFNSQMAELGAILIGYRALFLDKLSLYASKLHTDISGGRETLSIRYNTVSSIEDPRAPVPELRAAILRHMESHGEAELRSGSCLSGPHKDDLDIFIDRQPAKIYASQGQMRTAALALKLAERELFAADTGEDPLLLLDDVLSELDPRRRDFVLNKIGDGQVFITLCNPEEIQGFEGKTFVITDGRQGGS
ncbi:DNA replication/repair protein RecF [Oscillospiraceae bacterium OttesenSCG-928-F05]|nr:DNA replication/repair protein RecF [Oscillospiraceae bacterium OttesenSCG-928-F05]